MGLLDGKVAIITGAAGGQGSAEAHLFIAEGASVMLTDLSSAGQDIAGTLGARAAFARHDVSDEEQWSMVVDATIERFGGIDILVNNAAIYQPAAMMDTSKASLDVHYRVNQLGPFLGIKAVTPAMQRRGGGAIVNIVSGLGAVGSPGVFAYSATKWALRGISKCAAKELVGFNIRVNAVLPGVIKTPMIKVNQPGFEDYMVSLTPMARLGEAEEVARVVAFVASDHASYMTGAEIQVDGGLTT